MVLNYQRAKENSEWDSDVAITKNRNNGKLLFKDNAIKLVYSAKSKRIQSFDDFEKDKQYSFMKLQSELQSESEEAPF